jgi:hypothetical protein
MSTADSLYECCMRDEPVTLPVYLDYFGNASGLSKTVIVLGVYQGMVQRGLVSAKLLHNCLLSNRLNELVHAKHKHKPTYYYKEFCDMKLDLTNLPYKAMGDLPREQWMDIYDDNHCPNCNVKGYVTNEHDMNRMCYECQNMVCTMCFDVAEEPGDQDEDLCICKKCQGKL